MFDTLKNHNLGLFLLRVVVAIAFINHGLMKYNAMGFTVNYFTSLGLPAFMAYFVTYVELVGAVLMLLGIFVEVVGVALFIDMAAAMYITPWTRGFGAHEIEFTLGLIALAIAFMGAGRWAIPLKFGSKNLNSITT